MLLEGAPGRADRGGLRPVGRGIAASAACAGGSVGSLRSDIRGAERPSLCCGLLWHSGGLQQWVLSTVGAQCPSCTVTLGGQLGRMLSCVVLELSVNY